MAQRGMTPYKLSLTPGAPQSLNAQGDYFHVLRADADVKVRFDEGKQMELARGVGMRVYYERVELESDTSQDITVLLGFGHVSDSRATLNATVNATVQPGNVNSQLPEVTIAAGDSEKIADFNANRKFLRISIKSTEAGAGVYIGSATIGDNEGGWLEPGQTDYFPSDAETWAFNPGAVAITVSALDVERV